MRCYATINTSGKWLVTAAPTLGESQHDLILIERVFELADSIFFLGGKGKVDVAGKGCGGTPLGQSFFPEFSFHGIPVFIGRGWFGSRSSNPDNHAGCLGYAGPLHGSGRRIVAVAALICDA